MTPTSTMPDELPAEFARALEHRKDARDAFALLSSARKKEIIRWIESSRDTQHRIERVRMVVDVMLPNVDE